MMLWYIGTQRDVRHISISKNCYYVGIWKFYVFLRYSIGLLLTEYLMQKHDMVDLLEITKLGFWTLGNKFET